MDLPILVLAFNRPIQTRALLERLRQIKPSQLFIAADGPRSNNSLDAGRCREVRDLFRHIDWPCSVQRSFQDTNLGCRVAVETSLDWFFDHVECGVILEDDCIPQPSFFPYAQFLLDRYVDTHEVMMVAGSNLLCSWSSTGESYHFSACGSIWGWATWGRAGGYMIVGCEAGKSRTRALAWQSALAAGVSTGNWRLVSEPSKRVAWTPGTTGGC